MRPTIICDSREQKWEHVKEWLEGQGLLWMRSKLPVGDYTRMDNMSVVVDRKQNMGEVENNLVHQHDRFRRECELAQEHGIRLVVLIEDGRFHSVDDVEYWENPRRAAWVRLDRLHAEGKMLHKKIKQKPPISGNQMRKIMQAMQDRYGVEWRFCLHRKTGETICKILGVEVED